MSKTTNFNYEEKHHILIVDGNEYEIPQRTAGREKLIKEHDVKRFEMSEYEGNISLLKIFFGEKAVNKMFPDGDNTNLDKLARVCDVVIAAYNSEYENIQAERAEKNIQAVKPILETTEKIIKAENKVNTKNFVAKKKK